MNNELILSYISDNKVESLIDVLSSETIELSNGDILTVPVYPVKRGKVSEQTRLVKQKLIEYKSQLILEAERNLVEKITKKAAETAVYEYKKEVYKSKKEWIYGITFKAILGFVLMIDTVATYLNFHNLDTFMGDKVPWFVLVLFSIYLAFPNLIFAVLGNKGMVIKTSVILPFDFFITLFSEQLSNYPAIFAAIYGILILGVTVTLCSAFFKDEYQKIIFGEEPTN